MPEKGLYRRGDGCSPGQFLASIIRGQHGEMAGSTNEDFSVVDERARNRTDSREAIFSNANDREPLLHKMVPFHNF